MRHTRRTILRKASILSALAVGASGTATAAGCSGVQAWDADTAYNGGDQVTYDGALWTAEWWTRGTEPAESENVWTREGACGDGGGGNEAPTASFTTDVTTPEPGQDVTFDASGSADPDGSIDSYDWDFGDGSSASSQSVTHSYAAAGDYTVTLTVTDSEGATDTDSTTVSVSDGGEENAAPDASFTVSPASPEPGESTTFDAADSSDADGTIDAYEWDLGDGTAASGQTTSHSYGEAGDYTVTLTVTDDDGATDTNATTVSVEADDGGGGGGEVSPDTTLAEFYPDYDKDFYPDETEGGVPGLLENELHEDATDYGADVDAIQNDADDGSMELAALGDRGFELVDRFDGDGVPRENTARLMPWLAGLAEETEPIPFNDGSGRDGGLTADAGPVSATNGPSEFVQGTWPSGEQFDDVYHQSQRSDWSSGVSDSQYNNADNPIVDATTNKEHPVTGASLGDGFSANAPLEGTAELHGDGWLFDQSLIFKNTSDVPLLIDGAVVWWVGPSKGGTGLDQFSYDNAQRKNFSVGHPQRDVIEVSLPAASKPGPFEGTDAPLSAYGVRIAQHNNPYMYRTLYPNQKFSMTYNNATGPGQYDWPLDDLVDVMLDTCHVEFREDMSSIDRNTELVETLDMKNRYGN